MAENLDELLRPTLADARPRPTHPPYRVSSQGYVAFFGGVLAVTIVALINARRLRMSSRSQRLMAGAGALALAGEPDRGDADHRRPDAAADPHARRLRRLYWLQRSPERVYEYHARQEEPFDSLLPLGFALCILPGLAELAVLGAL